MDLEIGFSDMAGFEEVNLKDIAKSNDIYDNEVSEEELVYSEEKLSQEDLNELAYTNPQEFERIQSSGE